MTVVRIDQKIASLERRIIEEEVRARRESQRSNFRYGFERGGGVETIFIKNYSAERSIHGIVNTATVTANNRSRNPVGCYAKFPIPLKFEHDRGAIGEVFLVRKSRYQVYIQAGFFSNSAADAAWRLVLSGEVRMLSAGGGEVVPAGRSFKNGFAANVDGVDYYDRWSLSEVSICREGANPDCFFEILKAR